jgi:hypothetical protein
MWKAVHFLSKAYLLFIVGFSIYGSIATSYNRYEPFGELLAAVLVGGLFFPLHGPADLISAPSVYEGEPIWEFMQLNSWLFWPNLFLFLASGGKAREEDDL